MGVVKNVMRELGDSLATLEKCDQIVPRMNINPSGACIDIYPDNDGLEEEDERGFQAPGGLAFIVRARVDLGDTDQLQEVLLDWMDPYNDEGVAALLQADQTLNGYATSVTAGKVSGYTQYIDVNGKVSRIGAQWRVTVLPVELTES